MASKLVILYTTYGQQKAGAPYVVAFAVAGIPYYYKAGGLPELYDGNGTRMRVINMDDWMQVQTQQRYTLRSLTDMAESFAYGLHSGYSLTDVGEFVQAASKETLHIAFCSDLSQEVFGLYDVETTDVAMFDERLTRVRSGWDALQDKGEKFYVHLCRLWQYCLHRLPSQAPSVHKLIERLGRHPIEPPDPVGACNAELNKRLMTKFCGSTARQFKNIPGELLATTHAIHR